MQAPPLIVISAAIAKLKDTEQSGGTIEDLDNKSPIQG
jgi:hypothetical protein